MKRLNNITPQKDLCLPVVEDGKVASWQPLITFEHILDVDKLIASPEIQKILRYFYGQARPSVARTNYTDDLQFWLNHELYEADMDKDTIVYPFKASFEEISMDNPIVRNGEYSGPLNLTSFKPTSANYDLLAITCNWRDEFFRNDHYVIGVIADTDDLYNIITEQFQ